MDVSASHRPSSRGRVWLFRLGALIGVPLFLLAGVEVTLRVAGFGVPAAFFIPDDKPGYYRTNPEFLTLYLPRGFDLRPLNVRVAATKPANALRVVVLGESAAQGVPEPAFGFAPQLRAQLRARFPDREVEVINTGVVAINSHIVRLIAADVRKIAPDYVVIYLGNNEVVGPYGPGCAYLAAMPPLPVIRLSLFVRGTRIGQWVARSADWLATSTQRTRVWGGMSMFVDQAVRGDDPRLGVVARNYEENLRAMVDQMGEGGVNVILCTLVSNLKDCAPFLSLQGEGLTEAERTAAARAFAAGRLEWWLGNLPAAARELETAWRIDPRHADTAFLLGRIALAKGDTVGARRWLLEAQRWDALRFRPDPTLNATARRLAEARGSSVRLVDAARELGSDPGSSGVPAGRELLFEHVHFDWAGNYRVGRLLAEAIGADLPTSPDGGSWLDETGAARALGYTDYARAAVLRKNSHVIQAPPFTQQVTYVEDQAREAAEQAQADAESATAIARGRAKAILELAIGRDPNNPTLRKLLQDVDDDLGDTAAALDGTRRGQALQPYSCALVADEAIKLARLGRAGEAEACLMEAERRASDRDRLLIAPAWVDLFLRTRRFDEALAYLGRIERSFGDNPKIRLLRARVHRFAGDTTAAEAECRLALAAAPGNQEVLETLVELLDRAGRSLDVGEITLAALENQPNNHANNLRAAIIADQRGDRELALRALAAAEKSGPVSSAVAIRLGRHLLETGRRDDALLQFAMARRLARIEGDLTIAAELNVLIAKLRSPTEDGSLRPVPSDRQL